MGQYWLPVNLDKKEFIDPHVLGAGLKLWEQLASHPGTGAALVVLCAAMPEARGGGDLKANPDIVGRWAGDRIALVGDYAERKDIPTEDASVIYDQCCQGHYKDISLEVCTVIEAELGGSFAGEGWRKFREEETA